MGMQPEGKALAFFAATAEVAKKKKSRIQARRAWNLGGPEGSNAI
jgi:hypothetical protein